jgi:acyl-CoA synthetase (AMP-forming)/AMP-acid ligase II
VSPSSSAASGGSPIDGSFTTTLDVFDAVLGTAPDAEAFVDGDERMTFAEWAARADGVAEHLADRGVEQGDVVCFQLASCIDYAIAYQAVMRLGGITSGVNPRLGRAEVESIITRAEPKVVITDAALTDAAPIPAGPWQVIDRQVVRDAPPGDPFTRRVRAAATDTVAIVWTSGTTGVPKGAVFDHECLRAMADCAGVISAPGDRRISPLPFAHVGSMTRVWDELVNVISTLITPSPWNAGETLRLMEREHATVGQGVPTMWTLMLAHPDLPGTDLSSLRIAGTGAARVPPELVRDMQAKLGCPVVVRYASTEASLATGTGIGDDVETVANTVGRPPKGIELRISDEAGTELPAGDVGTVWLRSRAVMRGYWRDPEQTAKVITPDGWLVSGDLGWVGDDGLLRLVGRHAEMYIRGGYNVYPGEVENALGAHPGVASCAVLGGSVPVLGEIGIAFVVPKAGGDAPTLDELRTFVGERLADYKAPDVVVVMDALPLTSMGKIDKQVLRPQAEEAASGWVRPTRSK